MTTAMAVGIADLTRSITTTRPAITTTTMIVAAAVAAATTRFRISATR
jgi:hypothetical protein